MRAGLVCLALLLPAAMVGNGLAAESPDQVMVEMEAWIDGEQRGTPIVVVEPGKQASVEVGRPSEGEGWRVEVLVEPDASSDRGGNIWLQLALYERKDGELSLIADSLLGVPEGEAGVFSVVENGETGAPTPSTSLVYVSARASRLRPAERRD